MVVVIGGGGGEGGGDSGGEEEVQAYLTKKRQFHTNFQNCYSIKIKQTLFLFTFVYTFPSLKCFLSIKQTIHGVWGLPYNG